MNAQVLIFPIYDQIYISGIFEASSSSRFLNANLVFIPYCSSDAHLSMSKTIDLDFGDGTGPRTVYFNGQTLARTAVQVIVKKKEIILHSIRPL